jgi:hypothetical protein
MNESKGQREIWTRAARDLLFQSLVKRFGPYSGWEKTSSPGRGLDAEFDEFCEAFAKSVEAKSGDAVKHQIRFGSPVTNASTWKDGHVRTAILALASAFEAGFINNADLPVIMMAASAVTSDQQHSV